MAKTASDAPYLLTERDLAQRVCLTRLTEEKPSIRGEYMALPGFVQRALALAKVGQMTAT